MHIHTQGITDIHTYLKLYIYVSAVCVCFKDILNTSERFPIIIQTLKSPSSSNS